MEVRMLDRGPSSIIGPVLSALLALVPVGALAIEPVAPLAPNAPALSPPESDYAAPILAGISNQGRNREQPYVTAGDRAYLIGTQDGNFPDMGKHVPGEMGGLWLPPIKLVDGFQAQVTDADKNDAETNEGIVLAD